MNSSYSQTGWFSWMIGTVVLFTPAVALGCAAGSASSWGFAAGAIVFGFIAFFFVNKHPIWQPPIGLVVTILVLGSAAWLWTDPRGHQDRVTHIARGCLFVAGAFVFVFHELHRTGVEPRRKANRIVRQVLDREIWPLTLLECRDLPEVQMLRQALANDLSPIVRLMSDARPEVRAAGFAAVEGRRSWRLNEAKVMLVAAKNTVESSVRSVAVLALGNIKHQEIYTELATFLRDPSEEVRAACMAGLLSDGGLRWALIRDSVKDALLDPKLANDGSLPGGTGLYPSTAVVDLVAWASEGGIVSERAVRTLLSHYNYLLKTEYRVNLGSSLNRQLFDPKLSMDLRIGIVRLLKKHQMLAPQTLDRMTSADQPGPVRLMAAELLLSENPDNADGIDVLRGLGRQHNRETALMIARILQQYLQINVGLPAVIPAMHSKQAGEIMKRVVMWASGKSMKDDVFRSEQPTPTPAFGNMPQMQLARMRNRRDSEDEIEFGGGPSAGPQSIIQ